MHVIQEGYIPLESGDHKHHYILSVFKIASWIKLSFIHSEDKALEREFSTTVPTPLSNRLNNRQYNISNYLWHHSTLK